VREAISTPAERFIASLWPILITDARVYVLTFLALIENSANFVGAPSVEALP